MVEHQKIVFENCLFRGVDPKSLQCDFCTLPMYSLSGKIKSLRELNNIALVTLIVQNFQSSLTAILTIISVGTFD